MEVKFVIDLKHGKPRDKGDIENMFNAGRGRIYASAQGEEDILNLAGLDVATYGAVKAGKSQTEATQGARAGNTKSSQISNIKDIPNNQATSDSAEYISNTVCMFIDS